RGPERPCSGAGVARMLPLPGTSGGAFMRSNRVVGSLAAVLLAGAIVVPAIGGAAAESSAAVAACSGAFTIQPAPSAVAPATLMAVSGVASNAVYAAGSAENASGVHRTWVLRWNGTRWVQDSTPTGSRASYL